MGLSFWQIAIIVVVALLLFGGAGKITRLMGDFGSGLRAFKKGISDDDPTTEGSQKSVSQDTTVETKEEKTKE